MPFPGKFSPAAAFPADNTEKHAPELHKVDTSSSQHQTHRTPQLTGSRVNMSANFYPQIFGLGVVRLRKEGVLRCPAPPPSSLTPSVPTPANLALGPGVLRVGRHWLRRQRCGQLLCHGGSVAAKRKGGLRPRGPMSLPTHFVSHCSSVLFAATAPRPPSRAQ